MMACVAVIGLVPLALGAGQRGKELLHPLAIVVIGGLLNSTLMDQIVTPAVFFVFGRLYLSWFGRNPYLDEDGASADGEANSRCWPVQLCGLSGCRRDRQQQGSSGHFDHLKTEEALAAEMKVSPRPVRRDATYAQAVDRGQGVK